MKTLIRPFIYIMSALMVLSFASCNDFLDKEPEGKVPEDEGGQYREIRRFEKA